jgi:hypothetical protein
MNSDQFPKKPDDIIARVDSRNEPPAEPQTAEVIELSTASSKAREALQGTAQPAEPRSEARAEAPSGAQASVSGYDPNDLTRVPGVVGQLIDWTEQSSIYPSRHLALVPAIATIGTLLGNRVRGPSGAGTHIYGGVIADTGEGKGRTMETAEAALEAAGAGNLIGPGDYRSSLGIDTTLKINPVRLSLLDEYGDLLRRITRSNAAYADDTMGVMKKLWGYNFKAYHTGASKNDQGVAIFASFSVVGFSTSEAFYKACREAEIYGGFLNRHLILEINQPTELNPSFREHSEIPPALAQALKALYPQRTSEEILAQPVWGVKPDTEIGWGPGAEAIFQELARDIKKEPDKKRRTIFIRVAEIAVRVATIAAGGRGSRTVDVADFKWAKALALAGAETLYNGVKEHSYDPQDFAGLCQRVEDYLKASPDKIQTMRDINRKFTNSMKRGTDLEQVLKHLEAAEQIKRYVRYPPIGRRSEVVEWIGD